MGARVGYARFATNSAIEEFREGLAVGEWRNDKALRPRWNARKVQIAPWAIHLCQSAAKNAIRNVGKAISRWGDYRRALREGRPARYVGFPRWRKRGVHNSYQADNGRTTTLQSDVIYRACSERSPTFPCGVQPYRWRATWSLAVVLIC